MGPGGSPSPLRRPVSGTAILSTLCMLAACEGPPRSVAEGVGAPLMLGPTDVHVLGTSESLATVEGFEVLPDGSVWIQNSVEPFFIGFAPDGTVLREFGSQGGGPEEFGFPGGFVSRGLDGQAWVLDFRRHSLIQLSRPEAPWTEILLPRDSLPPGTLFGGMSLLRNPVRTARLGDEIIVPRSSGSRESGLLSLSLSIWGADLVALDPTTASTRTVLSLGEILDDPTAVLESVGEAPPIWLWFRLWAVCGGDEIRVYDRIRNEIRRFGADGNEGAPTSLPPVHLTEASSRQFANAIFDFRVAEVTGSLGGDVSPVDSARVINEILQEVEWTPTQLATILPRYVDFRCTDDGDLWIQPFDPDAGGLRGGPAWLRIAPDGREREIHFPDRFDVHQFTPDRIWGVQRDELDLASLAWIANPEIP